MRSIERAWAVDANYRSCLAFFGVLHAGLCTFNAHAHRRFNMSRNAGMVKRWPTALLPDVDDAQEASQQLWRVPALWHTILTSLVALIEGGGNAP